MNKTFYVVVDSGKVCGISFNQLPPASIDVRRCRGYKIEAPDAETAKELACELYGKGEKSSPDAFRKF